MHVWAVKNCESMYFLKDQEKLIGMNQARCAVLEMLLKNNKPAKVIFREKPEATFYPIYEVYFNNNRLSGFDWRSKDRPSSYWYLAKKTGE